MNLIIVESPTKARTLTRFLKGDYKVEATMGHIRDLPKSALGVDVEHHFEPKYVIPRSQQKRVGELKDVAAKAQLVILATDPDREGEAIGWHMAEVVQGSLRQNSGRAKFKVQSLQRIVFHEITESAIKEALEHPRDIDLKLVSAQQARRVLDRLVGYKLSPLLWQKLSKRWLSAGRVQSVAVRLIVEREREIEKFISEEYWTIEGHFVPDTAGPAGLSVRAEVGTSWSRDGQGPDLPSVHQLSSAKAVTVAAKGVPSRAFSDSVVKHETVKPASSAVVAQLISKDDVKYEKTLAYNLFDGKYTTTSSTIDSKFSAEKIIQDLKAPFIVSAVDKKEVRRYPLPPYTTSTLQQDAGRRLYFSAKRTMQLAQKLYEEGYITYHRTDSVNLAEKFLTEARTFIAREYGQEYVAGEPRRYKTKSKVAQEAHEAVRPTDVTINSQQLTINNTELNRDHARLYELIWKRALATQAAEAVFDSTTIDIKSSNGYLFEAQGSVIKFDGFLRITGRPASPSGGENNEVILPAVSVGESVLLREAVPTQHFTQPPPRYTEASLVKTLEEKGIGRPSTYAPIISTIIERNYVSRQEKKLVPTELGVAVTDFLVKYFPEIIDLPFTAHLEDDLDEIANGKKEWVPVVSDFYQPFAKTLADTYKVAEKVKLVEEKLGENCPSCGNPLVIRMGRYGKFIACSNFPACTYTRQYGEKIDQKCLRCGGDIVVKRSRKGKMFYGCSNYPKCTFAAWKKEDIK